VEEALKGAIVSDVTLLFATYLASANYKTYQYITEYVEKFTGIPSLLLNGEDLDDFSAGYIDAGFIAASDYALLIHQVPEPIERIATPVLQGISPASARNGCNKYKIVVRRDSLYQEVADLQESVFSYCFTAHESGSPIYQSLEQTLLACNACPLALSIKETVETTSHMHALRLVMKEEVDAAVVEASVLDLILRNSPLLTRELRQLGAYNLSRTSDVVVSTRLDAHVKQGLREAFRTIHQEPFYLQRLQEGSIERFLVIESNRLPDTPLTISALAGSSYPVEEVYAY
jgi:ABC-type phosphate/phosphonate transport system substrate-binding protein